MYPNFALAFEADNANSARSSRGMEEAPTKARDEGKTEFVLDNHTAWTR